jgi:hypothetical protein
MQSIVSHNMPKQAACRLAVCIASVNVQVVLKSYAAQLYILCPALTPLPCPAQHSQLRPYLQSCVVGCKVLQPKQVTAAQQPNTTHTRSQPWVAEWA